MNQSSKTYTYTESKNLSSEKKTCLNMQVNVEIFINSRVIFTDLFSPFIDYLEKNDTVKAGWGY